MGGRDERGRAPRGRAGLVRGLVRGLVLGPALLALAGCAGSTFTLIEENDSLSLSDPGDDHYTQGFRASWVFPKEQAPTLTRRAARAARVANATTEAIGVFVGQEMYTPENIRARRLVRNDRPYAGWLYGGMAVANVERDEQGPVGDNLDSYEIQVGVIGPESYASTFQKQAHEITGSDRPRGWRNQLGDEVGLVLSYEHRRRLFHVGAEEGLALDGIGGLGASLGNVFTHGQGSLTVRLGMDLPRDFGVNTIHRSVAEVGPPGDELEGFGWYLFASPEGRGVLRNSFLDGNTFRDSHSVEREDAVAEGAAGLVLRWDNWRLTFSQNIRTPEFEEQRHTQRFGSVSLQYQIDF